MSATVEPSCIVHTPVKLVDPIQGLCRLSNALRSYSGSPSHALRSFLTSACLPHLARRFRAAFTARLFGDQRNEGPARLRTQIPRLTWTSPRHCASTLVACLATAVADRHKEPELEGRSNGQGSQSRFSSRKTARKRRSFQDGSGRDGIPSASDISYNPEEHEKPAQDPHSGLNCG